MLTVLWVQQFQTAKVCTVAKREAAMLRCADVRRKSQCCARQVCQEREHVALPVIQHDVGALHPAQRMERQQPWVAGPSAYQVHFARPLQLLCCVCMASTSVSPASGHFLEAVGADQPL